jgi:hypothetical protein
MKSKQILFALMLFCVTACKSNTAMQEQPTERILASTANAPITGNAEADNQTAATKSRTLLVLLDSSRSYHLYEKAIDKLLSIVNALGPGDQLIIAQVAGKFRPETNIRLQAKFPGLPPELLVPSKRLGVYRQNQAGLDAVWQQVENRKKEITTYVTRHLVGKNNAAVTDFRGAIAYSAQRLNQESTSEKYLIIFSDLEHDFEKQKTSTPPAQQTNFANVHVCLLYVPWSDNWEGLQKEWATWFNRSGVVDFLMLEAGRSEQARVVAPVQRPQLPSPFK